MKVKIGDLTKIRTGKLDANASSEDGQYPFFTCSKEPLKISTYSYDCECVLVAGNGDLNVKYYKGKFDAYQRTYIIEDNSSGKLYMPYLYYFMEGYIEELRKQSIGGVIKYIKLGNLTDALIELPSVYEQKAIVKILEGAKNVIGMRNEELSNLDELIKSRFIELFGDPVGNPKGWTMVPLGTRCEIITGNTPSRAEAKNYGEFIEWIKSDNINTPYTFLTEAQEYLSEIGFRKCRFVEAGSLLMTCIAGSVNCIGNVAVADRRVAFNQQINAIVPDEDEVLYLYWLMLLSKPAIHRAINMALKGILSKRQLSEMMFPFPPVALQKQFVTFVEQTDKSKAVIQKALDGAQLLFDSLMQKYFGQ